MSYRILITEDDEFTAAFLHTSLKKIGYSEVDIASSGEETIKKCSFLRPDIVLMDIELSGQLDGIATANTIRETYNIPVIYVTSNTDTHTLKRALETNPNGYAIKPINGEQLYPLIEMSIRRHKLEHELRTLNENLEEKVRERTIEISQKNAILEQEIEQRKAVENKLKEALNKEKEVNELKSRVVSIVSHELKTPLTTILSSAQLIERHSKKEINQEKIDEHSQTIIRSVKLLNEIINDTLFLSKSDAQQIQVNYDEIELSVFLQKTIENIRIGLGMEHKITLKTIFPNNYKTQSDSRLLKQILNNIVGNAIKYSSPQTSVEIESWVDDIGWYISVSDEGIGIPKKDQKLLFEMFNRASNALNIDGTGIGLAIVKKCVDLLSGRINLISTENIGSKFTVFFPNKPKN